MSATTVGNREPAATVGNREVVFLRSFMVPDAETATFPVNFTIGATAIPVTLNVSITFLPSEEGAELEWRTEADRLFITTKGWQKFFGGATPKPIKLGEILGHPIGMFLFNQWTNGVNMATLQIVTGGTYE